MSMTPLPIPSPTASTVSPVDNGIQGTHAHRGALRRLPFRTACGYIEWTVFPTPASVAEIRAGRKWAFPAESWKGARITRVGQAALKAVRGHISASARSHSRVPLPTRSVVSNRRDSSPSFRYGLDPVIPPTLVDGWPEPRPPQTRARFPRHVSRESMRANDSTAHCHRRMDGSSAADSERWPI